ncbi:DUF6090 family protein [Winogradskyella immobilis]|uniref:Uncharacterized protein n=1 Tax=Winogradskyella immobilis TaxID=2816852 RepID=A0ABS8ELC1_9FLAO|nr:DUF6090 family protein [Winogradskyella immobilis]MCC1483958.1 hypothetical protein [Winogradskyella immobilis]MCG0016050.1 hypothetical protein [Winogradskyella immobilis]
MIKFFRHIRKSLLMENKTGKYFKYAIGEIILVVIGILIALQINNWNENRKERVQEQALLVQLQSEFNSNIKQLDEKITIRRNMYNSSLKLLHYIDNPVGINNDSILKHLVQTTLSPTFNPISTDFVGTGRIQLLQNNRLKELLTRWSSEIVAVTEEEIQWLDYSQKHYTPFLLEHTSFRNVLNSYWENNTTDAFNLDKGKTIQVNLKKSKTDFDESKVLHNPKLEDHMAFCASMAIIANSQSTSLRQRIVEILDLIGQDLN